MNRVHLPEREYASVTLFHPDTGDAIGICQSRKGIWYLLGCGEIQEEQVLHINEMIWTQTIKKEERIMLLAEEEQDGCTHFTKWYPPSSGKIIIGRTDSCHIVCESVLVSGIHGKLIWDRGVWHYEDLGSTNGSWINYEYVRSAELQFGDVLCFIDRVVVVGYGFLAVNQGVIHGLEKKRISPILPPEISVNVAGRAAVSPRSEPSPEYDMRPKTVWISMREREEHELEKPPPKRGGAEQEDSLAQASSALIGMAALSSGMVTLYGGIQQNLSWTNLLPSALMSVSVALSMIVFPLLSRRKRRKYWEKQEKKRRNYYLEYLRKQESRWSLSCKQEEKWLDAMFPMNLSQVLQERKQMGSRQFVSQHDVCVPLGMGDVEAAAVGLQEFSFLPQEDELLEEYRKFCQKPFCLKDVPILLKKKEYPVVQFCGRETEVVRYCRSILLWMAALFSPTYVKFVFFLDEFSWERWKRMRWLPHTVQEGRKLFAIGEQEWARVPEDCMVRSGEEVLYIAVVDCGRECAISESLKKQTENIWFWYLAEKRAASDAYVFIREGEVCVRPCGHEADDWDSFGKIKALDVKKEEEENLLRILNRLHRMERTKRQECWGQVSFLELFQVQRVEELDVAWRWSQDRTLDSLRVPVGMTRDGKVWQLDLHEHCHGPHMLMAGMTGSGKSECLITILLALAVCYSPQELTMVIIDYKGGGLAHVFSNQKMRLPHLAGVLTNLSDSSARRVLFALANEQNRRQKLFARVSQERADGGMDIDRYQKLCRTEKNLEPIPHLFLVVDEFAELKSGQPEFLEQLIHSARIGRSLGIHLILATQKPSGVVSEQIWSNSRTRICLKVQDKSDSMEVLHRPEAAALRQAGRFFVQCGQDDVFEEVQSAWSGINYVPNQVGKKAYQVLQVNHMGKVCRKAELVSGKQVQTQAASIVEYLQREALRLKKQTRELWLPNLEQSRALSDLKLQYPPFCTSFLGVLLGECDNPAGQSKHGLWWFPERDGNLLAAGGTLRERKTLLRGILRQIAASDEKTEIYCLYMNETRKNNVSQDTLEKGNESSVFGMDETGVMALFQELEQRLLRRKMGKEASDSLILLLVDDVAAFQENCERWMFLLGQIAREGVLFRMRVILMSSYPSEVRFRLQQSCSCKILFWMSDTAEFRTLKDNHVKLSEQIFGRGVVQKEEVYEFQMAKWE